ncbi:hypothetical protein Ancab_013526 [Ancistrocladus abbreviatus]
MRQGLIGHTGVSGPVHSFGEEFAHNSNPFFAFGKGTFFSYDIKEKVVIPGSTTGAMNLTFLRLGWGKFGVGREEPLNRAAKDQFKEPLFDPLHLNKGAEGTYPSLLYKNHNSDYRRH